MRQIWRQLAFLHWPVEPAAVAPLLPPGLDVDTFGGAAYVGIVPFTIPLTRAALLGAPIAPAFHEINLRTYVHRGGRDPGVWFFSLDATSRLAVAGARLWYGLPYFHADITIDDRDGAGRVPLPPARDRRRRFTRATSRWGRWRPPRPARSSCSWPSATCCMRRTGRGLRTARVHHAPYPLQPAIATDVEQTLTHRRRAAAGRLRGASSAGPLRARGRRRDPRPRPIESPPPP